MKSIERHERRNMIGITIFFCIVILGFVSYTYINDLWINVSELQIGTHETVACPFLDSLQHVMDFAIVVTVPMILYVSYLYGRDKVGMGGAFLASLPVKKNKVFMTRWLTGMIVYTIPWVLLSVVVLGTRIRLNGWFQERLAPYTYAKEILGIDSLWNLSIYLIYIWCSLTLMYAVVSLVQSICRKSPMGALISAGIFIFPNLMSACNDQLINQLIDGAQKTSWLNSVFLITDPINEISVWDAGVAKQIDIIYFNHILLVVFVQLLLSAILFVAAYYTSVTLDESKKGNAIYYPMLEKIFVAGGCFGVIAFVVIVGLKMQIRIGRKETIGLIFLLFGLTYYFIYLKKRERKWEK
ncbi:MAG: hypothetical protein ACOX1S_12190 [Anaerostipes sp.]|jgi:hypothetical protein